MKISQMAVVIDHHHEFKPFPRRQKCKPRCKLQSFTQADFSVLEIDPTKLAHSLKQAVVAANIHRSISTPCLPLGNDDTNNTSPKVEIVGVGHAPGVLGLVVETAIGMACGMDPTPVANGLGGAYYVRNLNGTNIALMKPIIDEPLAMKQIISLLGMNHGESAVREVAAYLLDHNGFAGVPPTALVKISNLVFHANNSMETTSPMPKIASIQRFVDHDFDAGDLGPSGFSVASVHRIGILDVRLLNLDRHAGNILVKKNKNENSASRNGSCGSGGCESYISESYVVGAAELVPIDHGFCLPELLDDPYFEWLHWPQSALPFSESEVEYICRLDPLKDAEILRTELPSIKEPSIRILVLCTTFLKLAVDAGLCLADIGDMMTREYCGTTQGPSVLETLCAKALEYMTKGFEEGHQSEVENEQDLGVFHLDMECEEDCTDVFSNLPRLLQSNCGSTKAPKNPVNSPPMISMSEFTHERSISEFTHEFLSPLQEDDDEYDGSDDGSEDENEENEKNGSNSDPKIGLMRSLSFPATKHKEIGSISFRDMSEEDWELFLENFEKQVPMAFEDRKRMGIKLRLGTSCKF